MTVRTMEGTALLVRESDMAWREPWVYLYDDDTRYGDVSLYEHRESGKIVAVIADANYPA